MEEKECALCKWKNFPFLLAFCNSHPEYPLVVSTTHKKEFSKEEKEMIQRLFPENKIGWQMKSIPDHAHAHIIPKGK